MQCPSLPLSGEYLMVLNEKLSLYFEIEMICNHLPPTIKGSSCTEECYFIEEYSFYRHSAVNMTMISLFMYLVPRLIL